MDSPATSEDEDDLYKTQTQLTDDDEFNKTQLTDEDGVQRKTFLKSVEVSYVGL
jgi:hypothetical protein